MTSSLTSFLTSFLTSSLTDSFFVTFSSTTATFSSSTEGGFTASFTSFGGIGLGSKSIFPTIFVATFLASALIIFDCSASSLESFSNRSFSCSKRIASNSFFFSSLTSAEAFLRCLSVEKASHKLSYSSSDNFVVGRATTSKPWAFKCSTALSKEMFNSLSTLFSRTVFAILSIAYCLLSVYSSG